MSLDKINELPKDSGRKGTNVDMDSSNHVQFLNIMQTSSTK
jgi:hypothetical protein